MNKIKQPSDSSLVAHELAKTWQSKSRQVREVAAMLPPQERNGFAHFTRVYQKLITQPRWLRRRLTRKARLTLADIAFMLSLGFALPAAAQNILVNTNIPAVVADGSCSLIEAIDNANADAKVHSDCPAGSGIDTIKLQSSSVHAITGPVVGSTNQGLPTITSQMVIQGNGATLKVAAVPVDTVINVASSGGLTLNNAIITGDEGSGSETFLPRVKNTGDLHLSNVKVLLNSKQISAITNSGVMTADRLEVNTTTGVLNNWYNNNGHGILNSGNVELSNSQIKNLYFYTSPNGAVINQGNMTLLNTSVIGNYGGSCDVESGIGNSGVIIGKGVTVTNRGYCGLSGVRNSAGAVLTLEDSVIAGGGYEGSYGLVNDGQAYFKRVEMGGIRNYGHLELVDGTISGDINDYYSGVFNAGDMQLTGANISNNNGYYFGGIRNSGSITITNSIVSNNSSIEGFSYYENISNLGTMKINSSTITSNFSYFGPGGFVNSGSLSLSHSIVTSYSFSDRHGPVITNVGAGVVLANDYNLFGDSSLTNAQAFIGLTPGDTDVVATSDGTNPTAFTAIMDTGVGSFGNTVARVADNGGLTKTIALVAGSPAIDTAGSLCVPVDQRNIARPQGAACDIGAFEWAGAPGPTADLSITMTDSPDPITKSTGNYLVYTITATNNSSNVAKAVSVTDTRNSKKMTFISANATQGACTESAGVVMCNIGNLAANASATVKIYVQPTISGTIPNSATVSGNGADPNHANNVASVSTTVLVSGVDMLEQFTSNPPAEAAFGSGIPVTDTVYNQGAVAAGASKTRYYLSLDTLRNTGDLLLTGSRAVPSLASGASTSGGTNVTISKASIGSYYLLACADDTKVVAERNEKNNCRASLTTMLVKGVDLLETAISKPPASVAVGGSFLMTDTAMNQGNLASGTSKTRYYLSLDKVRNTGDRLLTGSRSVSLAPYTSSTGTITVKVPSTTPKKAYYLLACADDTKAVKEVNEKNNCLASTGNVTVQ